MDYIKKLLIQNSVGSCNLYALLTTVLLYITKKAKPLVFHSHSMTTK